MGDGDGGGSGSVALGLLRVRSRTTAGALGVVPLLQKSHRRIIATVSAWNGVLEEEFCRRGGGGEAKLLTHSFSKTGPLFDS